MNGTRAVDEEMTERVRAAARELDYSPSPLARSLVLGRTNTVAVVVPDLGNPTFHGVLRGLSHAASRNGYHVLVADSAESVTDELALAQQTRRRCDGLVLVAPRMAEADLDRLRQSLQPVVVVNREPSAAVETPEEIETPVVTADYRSGLTGLLDLLHADGHRSLMFLAGAPQSASNMRRLAALEQFVSAHPDLTVQIRQCGVNFADGYDAAGAIMEAGVTGVLAFNDLVAMGLISALTEAGIAGSRGGLGGRLRRHPVRPVRDPAPHHGGGPRRRAGRAGVVADVGPLVRPSAGSDARAGPADRAAGQHRTGPSHGGGQTRGNDRRPLTCGRGAGQGPSGSGPAGEGRGRHLPPVVAMPLTRNFWPKRNTRNNGISVTTDIANIAPQLLPEVASRKPFSATETVYEFGSVK